MARKREGFKLIVVPEKVMKRLRKDKEFMKIQKKRIKEFNMITRRTKKSKGSVFDIFKDKRKRR